MTSRLSLAAIVVAALGLHASAALAGDAECSYVEIAATNAKDGTVDPDLKPLEKKLKKPPFTAWNSFKKLSSGDASLSKNKVETLKLKAGSATIMLRDRSAKRVELTVTMDNVDGKRILETKPAIKAGDWLLVVGTNAKDDGHMVGLTCK